jgi:hypothetical protein
MTTLTAPAKSHLVGVFRALAESGWTLRVAPVDGRLPRNGQRVILQSGTEERRFRLFVYKVTGSGRQKPYERRIEITSTYQKGLRRMRGYPDVVLGVDTAGGLFVGVDPRRIAHGGATGNASSFFDISGLSWNRDDEISVFPRSAKLFPGGVEFHAFLKSARLAEYFFNFDSIHSGTYTGAGLYAGRSPKAQARLETQHARGDAVIFDGPKVTSGRRRVREQIVEAYEAGEARVLRRRKVTPDQLLEIKRQMEENGRLGEEFALNYERRMLRRAGRQALADGVRWVSQESVGEGYDILSFEITGDEKWIEVKSTTGTSRSFEMSDYEWRTCCSAGRKYYIYRVTNVRTKPSIEQVRDPRQLEQQGRVSKSPLGWKVTLS